MAQLVIIFIRFRTCNDLLGTDRGGKINRFLPKIKLTSRVFQEKSVFEFQVNMSDITRTRNAFIDLKLFQVFDHGQ